ncbi:sensor histidine kinase [Niabella aquatica]
MSRNQNSLVISRYLTDIINTGVHPDLPIIESRRVKMLNILTMICMPFVVLFLALNIVQNRYLLVGLNLANLISLLLLILMHKHRLYQSAKLVRIAFSIIIYTLSGLFYQNGTEYCLVGTLVILILVFDNKWLIGGLSILTVAAILAVLNFNIDLPGEAQISPGRINSVVAISLMFVIVTVVFFKYVQSDYQQEIEARQQDLVMTNQNKERLFSIVSHDIRGPLLSLERALDMYRSDLLDKEDMLEATGSFQKKVAQLNNTIGELLRWSASGMQGIQTKPVFFPLTDLLNEVLHFFEFIMQQKGIAVNVNVPDNIRIFADRDQVAVVLRNLLGNALKFSYPGGEVSVSAENAADGVAIYIKDQGTGMDEEIKNKLFSSRQNPAYGTNGERGAGLGLLLSKEFITKNDGDIALESSPGKGTCFRLLFQKGKETQVMS